MGRRLTYEQVQQYIELEDYQLVSTTYVNNYTKLEIRCPQEHQFEMRYNDFQQGQRCPHCAKNKKLTYQQIKSSIGMQRYRLLTGKYKKCSYQVAATLPSRSSV